MYIIITVQSFIIRLAFRFIAWLQFYTEAKAQIKITASYYLWNNNILETNTTDQSK